MSSFIRVIDRRTGFLVVALAFLIAIIAPTIAMAAQLTERSIELTSSSVSATDVTYKISFKSVAAAGAFVVDFCSDSPVVGQTCEEPEDFTVAGVSSTTTDFTSVAALDANTVRVTGDIDAATQIVVELDGIDNPSVAGPLYARIVTYDTPAHANSYAPTVLGTGKTDDGGAAIAINNTIGVSGAVLESITFCVSGEAIDKDCDTTGNAAPTIKLGEQTGDVIALSADDVSTGSIFTQLSTNALTGAVVSLKSSAIGCGGLVRAGAPTSCNILPALLTGGIAAGDAKFGVKTGTVTNSSGATPTGTLQPFASSPYNTSTFTLNYVTGDATGVTSTYGDPFLDSAGAPVNNKNMELTFGASISNSTPAGLYSVDLGLIATGKF